jgi:hypothetical protein
MLKITIFNDTEQHLDADFDVIELVGGKEINRYHVSVRLPWSVPARCVEPGVPNCPARRFLSADGGC